VTFEDSIYCFARTEFFSVLLGADPCRGADLREISQ
jgi:hypothetical protein